MLPDVKPYNFYTTGKGSIPATLREALVSEKWDYVTLQQVSDKKLAARNILSIHREAP